jgi:two-component system, response regulator
MSNHNGMMEEKKIILIEDDPDHADLIAEALGMAGMEDDIVIVHDGMQAIDLFQDLGYKWNGEIQHKIRLVLLDLNLPKISGMEILKFIKKNPKYNQIPVIVLSTSSDQKTIDEAYKSGADNFVTKPLSYEDLFVKLEVLKECY